MICRRNVLSASENSFFPSVCRFFSSLPPPLLLKYIVSAEFVVCYFFIENDKMKICHRPRKHSILFMQGFGLPQFVLLIIRNYIWKSSPSTQFLSISHEVNYLLNKRITLRMANCLHEQHIRYTLLASYSGT